MNQCGFTTIAIVLYVHETDGVDYVRHSEKNITQIYVLINLLRIMGIIG